MAIATTSRTGGRQSPADKHDARRTELAEAALLTLGEVGYARTSLREVAQNSAFSHGVVHYYFTDKLDLIIYSVRHYKAQCVTRYDAVVADAEDADGLLVAFAAKLAETIREEAPMHRLWYDLRAQSMFDEALRESVTAIDAALQEMIWRVVARYAELAGRSTALPPATAYAVLDGVFQATLLAHLTGSATALEDIAEQVHGLLPLMLERA